MGTLRDESCGGRTYRRTLGGEGHVPMAESKDINLTSLGAAMLEALREDDRFRAIIDDPFGDHETPAA
jgi:hypothetical protein